MKMHSGDTKSGWQQLIASQQERLSDLSYYGIKVDGVADAYTMLTQFYGTSVEGNLMW